jgi:Right handed beta helix region
MTVLLAGLVAATVSTAASSAPTCYTNSVGDPEVNVGAQFGYTDQAIRAALAVAEAGNCRVHFQAGTYTYSAPLDNNGLRWSGICGSTILQATNPVESAVRLKGNSPQLVCVTVRGSATTRTDTFEGNGVHIDRATNFLVDHVTVERVSGAGIFNFGGNGGRITTNTVRNTFADGIHNTFGAAFTSISFNTVTNTGDDFIAVVSYIFNATRSHDITIASNNVGSQPHGRGITVVGGYNVTIRDNRIQSCSGACIHLAAEEGDFGSQSVDNVVISDNFVRSPDLSGIHFANIYSSCARAGAHIAGISGSGNDVDQSKLGVRTAALNGCAISDHTVTSFYGN